MTRDLLLIKTPKKERRKSAEDGCTILSTPQKNFTKKLRFMTHELLLISSNKEENLGKRGRLLDVQQYMAHHPWLLIMQSAQLQLTSLIMWSVVGLIPI
jgi:hypothetical protein